MQVSAKERAEARAARDAMLESSRAATHAQLAVATDAVRNELAASAATSPGGLAMEEADVGALHLDVHRHAGGLVGGVQTGVQRSGGLRSSMDAGERKAALLQPAGNLVPDAA